MDSSELRKKFLSFFEKKGHKIIPSASLIPENDPTVLFTTAGMHPLVPFLLGEKHPSGKRLASCQKCIRTGDIEDVGDDTHLTFFEMLGNWSLGDYWKEDAIKWSLEFLTKELNIPLERLAISCFAGDNDAPKDEESAKIWENLGIKKERIAFLPKEDNWWGPAGQTGPCGPDTEMFYWKLNDKPAPEVFDPKDKNWVEIWNDVFMQYIKDENGNYNPAKQKNVDTGMGLERTIAVLNGKENVYETDLFLPIISKILSLVGIVHDISNIPLSVYPRGNVGSNLNQEESIISVRVLADHIKAATFLIADGVVPSNKDRGYILRRLIRRIVTRGKRIGISKIGDENFLPELAEVAIKLYEPYYTEIKNSHKKIVEELGKEEGKFRKTLMPGLQKIEEYVAKKENASKFMHSDRPDFGSRSEDYINLIFGKDAFDLYQTYGFPPELLNEELARYGMGYHKEEFKKIMNEFQDKMEKHQDLSRTASAGMFKGGLADSSEQTTKLHTAAHLMLAGLRKVLGDHVVQKGSNITAERLRFDFSHKEKMTSGQIKDVENFVNDIIKKDLPVDCEEMTLEKARELNAMGVFESKYGEKVKVYTVGQGDDIVSREICGGPHVDRTGILGHFKIIKEESSSSGIRRIKAILE
jgi:alanyl-tRNA synthetase